MAVRGGFMDLAFAREVLESEARAIAALAARVDERFLDAVRLILKCKGRVVVTGMGKPGLIGQKISATLASTGTPSYALHPAEALHGDLGRVVKQDVVLVISNSGETDEIVRLLPLLKKIGAKVIGMTGKRESSLARHADVLLDIGPIEEACPLGLAPTTSTTAMLALGDALALAVQKERQWTPEEYAFFHPGGSLGRRLLRVEEIMRKGAANPIIPQDRTVKEALFAITEARAGAISCVDKDGRLTGIFTDGDLRRHLATEPNVEAETIANVMTRSPITIAPERLAAEAAQILRERRIDELPVVDGAGRPVGMIDIQDLLAVGLV
jgi:arabinose-5-phosphate isomerase